MSEASNRRKEPLVEQAEEVVGILQNHFTAWNLSRDEKRCLLMCIHRLERGLAGEYDTDPGRTLADWISA